MTTKAETPEHLIPLLAAAREYVGAHFEPLSDDPETRRRQYARDNVAAEALRITVNSLDAV